MADQPLSAVGGETWVRDDTGSSSAEVINLAAYMPPIRSAYAVSGSFVIDTNVALALGRGDPEFRDDNTERALQAIEDALNISSDNNLEEDDAEKGSAMADMTRDEIEQRFQNAELKTDLKFEKLNSKLDLIIAGQTSIEKQVADVKREVTSNRAVYVSLILGLAIAVGGIVVGLFAYGAAILDMASGLFSAGAGIPKK